MLKIKDNVDLKELEKFSFLYNSDRNVYIGTYCKDYGYYIDFKRIEIGEDRNIFIFGRNRFLVKYKPKYIKKLIQAGLVEKVEEV